MYKVHYTNGESELHNDESDAMALYDAAQGRADVYVWSSEVQDWFLIADGWEWE